MAAAPTYDLYVQRRNQDGDRFPHWYLVTIVHNPNPPPMIKCTRYHSVDGPTSPNNKPYRVAIEGNANFRSVNLVAQDMIRGGLTEADLKTITRICNSIKPHQCQKYVVCVLAEMQRRGMVPTGTAERYAAQVQMSDRVRQFEATHPPPDPVGIRLPASWPRASPAGSPAASRPPSNRPSPGPSTQQGHARPVQKKKKKRRRCVVM